MDSYIKSGSRIFAISNWPLVCGPTGDMTPSMSVSKMCYDCLFSFNTPPALPASGTLKFVLFSFLGIFFYIYTFTTDFLVICWRSSIPWSWAVRAATLLPLGLFLCFIENLKKSGECEPSSMISNLDICFGNSDGRIDNLLHSAGSFIRLSFCWMLTKSTYIYKHSASVKLSLLWRRLFQWSILSSLMTFESSPRRASIAQRFLLPFSRFFRMSDNLVSSSTFFIFYLLTSEFYFAAVLIDEGVKYLWASPLLVSGKTSAGGGLSWDDFMWRSLGRLEELSWAERSVMSLRSVKSPVRPVYSPEVTSLIFTFYFTFEADGASDDSSCWFSISFIEAPLSFLLSWSSGSLMTPNWPNLRTMFCLQNLKIKAEAAKIMITAEESTMRATARLDSGCIY